MSPQGRSPSASHSSAVPPSLGLQENLEETAVNLISEGTRLEGRFFFEKLTRIHGCVQGSIISPLGSLLIVAETGFVEGTLEVDSVFISGCVEGTLIAQKKVVISSTGKVIGHITTPTLEVEFGSYFDGQCTMNTPDTTTPLPESRASSAPPPIL